MSVLGRVFERIADRIAASAPKHRGLELSLYRHYCPHCAQKTEWHVNVLYRFYLCMQCRQDPLLEPSEHADPGGWPEDRTREFKRGDQTVSGRRDGNVADPETAPV